MFGNIKTSVNTCKAVLLIMLTSFTLSWADVPAPPVNQNLGIPDSQFNNLQRENCWYCHAPDRLTDVNRTNLGWTFTPPTVKAGAIPDRHHLRVVREMKMGANTQAPYGVPGEVYNCQHCHAIDPATSMIVVDESFKNCLNCHKQMDGKASVHHLTEPAQALNCKHCHGSVINNPNDGHYIPTGRTPSMVTPRTSGGKGPNGEGACTFCHNAGVESVSGIDVKTNSVNHHSTGIGQVGVGGDVLDCTVCHDQTGSDWAIRRCEDCHGISSIHTIQADTDGDGNITVYGEAPGFGHIGKQSDCLGCHGGILGAASTPIPSGGPVVPQINDLSVGKITAGSATKVTFTGIGLTNNAKTATGLKTYKSTIVLTDPDGITTELTPESISATQAVVTLPPNLEPGSYAVRAVKESLESAPVYLVVVPDVVIEWAEFWSGNTLTVEGRGFGSKINSSVTVNGTECSITSWTDTLVIAECPEKCGQLVLNTLFGTATDSMYGGCETAGTEALNPTIDAIDSDYYWDIVTLDGSGFGVGANAKVTVNGDECKVTAWSDTKIVAEECPIRGCDTLIAISDTGSFTKLLDCD